MLTVFRGAVVAGKNGTRKLGTTRPSAVPVMGTLAKALPALPLAQFGERSFYATCLTQCKLVKVLGRVHAEAAKPRSKFVSGYNKGFGLQKAP